MEWNFDGRPVYKSAETYFWGATTEDSVRGGRVVKVKETDPSEYMEHVFIDGAYKIMNPISNSPLAAAGSNGDTITGDAINIMGYRIFVVSLFADTDSELIVEQSDDSSHWYKIYDQNYTGNSGMPPVVLHPTKQYVRVIVKNLSANAQSILDVSYALEP